MVEFETKRLYLRSFRSGDEEYLFSMYSNKELMKYIGNGKAQSRNSTEKFVKKMLHQYFIYDLNMYLVFLKYSRQVIGRIGFIVWEQSLHKNSLELSWLIDQDYQNRDFATEAALELVKFFNKEISNYNYLYAFIHDQNESSKRVAEKIGMDFQKKAEIKGISASIYSISKLLL